MQKRRRRQLITTPSPPPLPQGSKAPLPPANSKRSHVLHQATARLRGSFITPMATRKPSRRQKLITRGAPPSPLPSPQEYKTPTHRPHSKPSRVLHQATARLRGRFMTSMAALKRLHRRSPITHGAPPSRPPSTPAYRATTRGTISKPSHVLHQATARLRGSFITSMATLKRLRRHSPITHGAPPSPPPSNQECRTPIQMTDSPPSRVPRQAIA